jgi:hypothetical protein
VFDFASRWGRLTPLETHLRSLFDSLPSGLDWLIPQVADATNRQAVSQLARSAEADRQAFPRAHSLLVEAHYLRVLRALTGHVIRTAMDEPPVESWTQAGFRGDDPKPWGTFVMTMNAALKPFSVHVRYPGADALTDAPRTYEVAVLQLAQLIAEDRQVRPCANERCTRLFTRQRGRAKYDKTGHSTGVLYCSASAPKLNPSATAALGSERRGRRVDRRRRAEMPRRDKPIHEVKSWGETRLQVRISITRAGQRKADPGHVRHPRRGRALLRASPTRRHRAQNPRHPG